MISDEERTKLAVDAMRTKRFELINAPLDRIYGDLFKAGQSAYLNGDVVVPRDHALHDFKTGDRVKHISRDQVGTVTILENGDVSVQFDGSKFPGIYDVGWFESHPGWLIRATATE